MKTFEYIASNEQGVRKKGAINAPNEEKAREQIKASLPIVISIIEKKKSPFFKGIRPNLSFQEKAMFTKHMATMMQVGITVSEGLEIISSQTQSKRNQKMFQDIIERVKSGQTLAKSLKEYEDVFSEVFVNMVEVGEESGTLEKTFKYLEIQLEKEADLRSKVVSAFIYPAVIIGVTILLMFGIILFVMPKILRIFDSFDVTLPLPTRILIGFSGFITDKPLISIMLLFGIITFSIFIFKVKFMKPIWARIFFHVPVFGKIIRYVNLARFMRNMNSLLQAGVGVTESLQITEKMIGNPQYKEAIHKTYERVEQGGKLSEAIVDYPKLFPPLISKMVLIGETSGSIEQTTEHLAQLYEKNVDNITKNLSTLLEPILLVFMGALVGGVAISIIMPIYQLPNLIQQ